MLCEYVLQETSLRRLIASASGILELGAGMTFCTPKGFHLPRMRHPHLLASPRILPCYFCICSGYGTLLYDDGVLLTTNVSIKNGSFLEHLLCTNKWGMHVMQEWGSQACFVLRWAPRQSPSLTMIPRLSGLDSAKHLYMHAHAAILQSSSRQEI